MYSILAETGECGLEDVLINAIDPVALIFVTTVVSCIYSIFALMIRQVISFRLPGEFKYNNY